MEVQRHLTRISEAAVTFVDMGTASSELQLAQVESHGEEEGSRAPAYKTTACRSEHWYRSLREGGGAAGEGGPGACYLTP